MSKLGFFSNLDILDGDFGFHRFHLLLADNLQLAVFYRSIYNLPSASPAVRAITMAAHLLQMYLPLPGAVSRRSSSLRQSPQGSLYRRTGRPPHSQQCFFLGIRPPPGYVNMRRCVERLRFRVNLQAFLFQADFA